MADDATGPAEAPKPEDVLGRIKQLEARVAELHDKLSKLHITEEEWKAYQKVNSVLAGYAGVPQDVAGGGAGPPPPGVTPIGVRQNCVRCFALWIAACVLPACFTGGGTNPGPDFGGLGSSG